MNDEKVVYITPYYNREDLLEMTISPMVNQTYKNLEIVVINDGSTDNTKERLKELEERLPITVISHSNRGLYPSLNEAIRNTDSKYIAIQGSGDVPALDRIQKQVEFLQKNLDYGLVAARFQNYSSDGETYLYTTVHSGKVCAESFQSACQINHGTVMYRRTAFEGVGGYLETLPWAADYLLFYRVVKAHNGYILPDCLNSRYLRLDGASYNPKKAYLQVKCVTLIKKIIRNEIEEKDIEVPVSEYALRFPKDLDSEIIRRVAMFMRRSHWDECGEFISIRRSDKLPAGFRMRLVHRGFESKLMRRMSNLKIFRFVYYWTLRSLFFR